MKTSTYQLSEYTDQQGRTVFTVLANSQPVMAPDTDKEGAIQVLLRTMQADREGSRHATLAIVSHWNGDTRESQELDLTPYTCADCNTYLNPAERFAAPRCGACVRKAHRKVAGRR